MKRYRLMLPIVMLLVLMMSQADVTFSASFGTTTSAEAADTIPPHFEITRTDYRSTADGNMINAAFPTEVSAYEIGAIVARCEDNDIDHAEFVYRPAGSQTWNLIDGALYTNESGSEWTLGDWYLSAVETGWYEYSVVGVDTHGNIDWNCSTARVYVQHRTPAWQDLDTQLIQLVAIPSVTNGPTTFQLATALPLAGGIRIYDTSGRCVDTMEIPQGTTQIHWMGMNQRGEHLPSGIYFAQLADNRSVPATRIVINR